MLPEKLIKDNKVAVLYSPGFGAGWSTWTYESQELINFMIFDKTLVEMAERKANCEEVESYIKYKFPYKDIPYLGGWKAIEVAWIDIGVRFRIEEYDGSERIVLLEPDNFYVA